MLSTVLLPVSNPVTGGGAGGLFVRARQSSSTGHARSIIAVFKDLMLGMKNGVVAFFEKGHELFHWNLLAASSSGGL